MTGPGSDHPPLRAQEPVTDAERARVAELHALGWSRAAIAREIDRGPSTVGRIAQAAGLTWDRSKTAVATVAKQMDNRARRALLIEGAYDQAAAVLDRLKADDGYDASGTATNGQTVTTRVALPPAHDVKALAGSFALFMGTAAKAEAIDTDNGAEHAKGILGLFVEGLAVVAAEIEQAEQ